MRGLRALRKTARPLTWLRDQVDHEERRLLLQSVIVGVVAWAFAAALQWSVHAGVELVGSVFNRASNVAFVLIPLVAGAVVVSLIVRFQHTVLHYRDDHGKLHPLEGVEGDGLERAIALYFTSEPSPERKLLGEQGVEARWRLPTFSLALRKMVASWVTLVSGGAGGLEASVTLVGESTAAGMFKPRLMPNVVPERVKKRLSWLDGPLEWWRATQPEDLQAAQLCGIAAGISTLLGTPFAAAFFAIEIIYRRRPIVDRLIYALVSSLVAFFLNHFVTGMHTPFAHVAITPPLYDAKYYAAVSLIAVTMGVLSTGFRALRAWAEKLFQERIRIHMQRHVAGALCTGTIAILATVLIQTLGWTTPPSIGHHGAGLAWLVLGPGDNMIDAALRSELTIEVALVALVGRFLATISTITSGGSAGLLFPTLCFGCLTAAAWAHVFELETPLLAVPAMTAALTSVANVPLAALLFVIEAFGAQWIVPGMFALVIGSVFAHRNSIYRAQRDTFDKGQVLPGVSVRRIRVPSAWADKDLRELGVRDRFGLTVIGMIDRRQAEDGLIDERIVLNPEPSQLLSRGDILIVLGEDDRIERFVRVSQELTLTGMPAITADRPAS